MKVTMLLADHVAAVEGKLYINGAGWTMTGPAPSPSAIALLLEIPWDQTNRKHEMRIDLIDADGNPIIRENPDGSTGPITINGDFEVGRPPGLPAGSPIAMPVALNMGPLPIPPGGRYSWVLYIDGETHTDWVLRFSTRVG